MIIDGNATDVVSVNRWKGFPPKVNYNSGMQGLRRVRGLRGLGDTAIGTDETATDFSWLNQVPSWIKDIQVAVNTQKLLDLNLQRAAQGLPPITSAAIAPTLNLGMSPETQQLVMYGGIALLAVLLLSKRKK